MFKNALLFVGVTVFLWSCKDIKENEVSKKTVFNVENVSEISNPRNISQEWKTDSSKQIIPLNELTALLKRNAIKPLNSPRYLDNEVVKDSLFNRQPVLAVEINGESRAYPLNILSSHEIVNDSIGNLLFSVAYCPLCNTAVVFNRKLNHNNKEYTLKFGTSGMLRYSNLVMWDEETESWWQHINGEALVGELAGAKLEIIPSKIIALSNYFKYYPNGKTLFPVIDTTYKTNYEINNYLRYDSIGKNPRLFFTEIDNRLPAMEYVVAIEKDNSEKIYPLNLLKEQKVINDILDGDNIVLFYDSAMISNLDTREIKNGRQMGSATVFSANLDNQILTFVANENENGFIDNETGSQWNFIGRCISGKLENKQLKPITYSFDFAFAWFAFNPVCKVYDIKE